MYITLIMKKIKPLGNIQRIHSNAFVKTAIKKSKVCMRFLLKI